MCTSVHMSHTSTSPTARSPSTAKLTSLENQYSVLERSAASNRTTAAPSPPTHDLLFRKYIAAPHLSKLALLGARSPLRGYEPVRGRIHVKCSGKTCSNVVVETEGFYFCCFCCILSFNAVLKGSATQHHDSCACFDSVALCSNVVSPCTSSFIQT